MVDHILSILIFFPVVAALFGVMIHKDSIRAYGITVSVIEFVLSLWMWFAFDGGVAGMQFMESVPLIPAFGINYTLGVDGISIFIIILSTFFTMLGIASLGEMKKIGRAHV